MKFSGLFLIGLFSILEVNWAASAIRRLDVSSGGGWEIGSPKFPLDETNDAACSKHDLYDAWSATGLKRATSLLEVKQSPNRLSRTTTIKKDLSNHKLTAVGDLIRHDREMKVAHQPKGVRRDAIPVAPAIHTSDSGAQSALVGIRVLFRRLTGW